MAGRARVLIAFDGSPSAATAVRAAASLFAGERASVLTVPQGTAVRLGTAVPTLPGISPAVAQQALDELRAEARQEAEETARQAVELARTHGLDADPVAVEPSDPTWWALLDAAHRLDADVLVCGTRGRGAFARALLGSTSTSLLHNTDVPLLVVPDGGGALDGPVVLAYDGSEASGQAIEAAGRLLGGRAAVVVHAWEPLYHRSIELVPDLQRALAGEATATTEKGVAAARAAGLDAIGDTVESDHGAWQAVAAAARSHGASLIAMGSRGLGSVRSVLLGSVSSGLIQNAELPVLVVPAQAGAGDSSART